MVRAAFDGIITVWVAVGAALGPLLVVVTYSVVGESDKAVVGPVSVVVRSKADAIVAVAALFRVRPPSLVVVLTLAVAVTGAAPLVIAYVMVDVSVLPEASVGAEVVVELVTTYVTRPVLLL